MYESIDGSTLDPPEIKPLRRPMRNRPVAFGSPKDGIREGKRPEIECSSITEIITK